jgi:hypothetical protein
MQAEFDQDAGCVRRKLQPRADPFKAFSGFDDKNTTTLRRQRKRCRQASDSGTGDNDGA